MDHADILIFAVIAVILFARLWSVLGRRGDDEQQRPNPFVKPARPPHDEEDVMVLPERAKALPSPQITASGYAAASLAGGLDQLKTLDPEFDEKQFLQGAKAAFTMIVDDFAKGELTRATRLLAPAVLENFRNAIAARVAAGQTLESKIDGSVGADMTAARLEGTRALLTVEFVSRQINVTRNAQGQIVTGTPGQAEEIRDLWVFARDTKSDDPNWILIETRS